jgi:hypothetical protein
MILKKSKISFLDGQKIERVPPFHLSKIFSFLDEEN